MDKKEFSHIPVLLNECIEALDIKPEGIYIDGTAGGAGHSVEIARRLTTGRLVAIDKDPDAIAAAGARLASYPQAQVVLGDFKDIPQIAQELHIDKVDGILLDLGVSSHQLDSGERGFSYHMDAPLDMRMGQKGLSARDVVNGWDAGAIARILQQYGEERFARRIAQNIVHKRAITPIETTLQLAEIIKEAIPAATRREGGHPAKRSFQAIRIAVNGELESLGTCLEDSFSLLRIGGRFAVITFHSLEDRIVKQCFAGYAKGCTCPPDFPICVCGKTPKAKFLTRKPIEPSSGELEANNRSRSARLRVIERL